MNLFDFFKIKQYKSKIEILTNDNSKLINELNNLKKRSFSLKELSIVELESKEKELTENVKILELKSKNIVDEINKLTQELNLIRDDANYDDVSLYIPQYNFINSEEYKNKYLEIHELQKSSIRNETAYWYSKNYTFNNSKQKGVAMLKKASKLLIRAFNTECEAAITKIKYSNVDSIKNRITKSFNAINNSVYKDLCGITKYYLDLKLQEVNIAFEYELNKEKEKELLREQKNKEREEKLLHKEVENKLKILNKELTHFETAKDEIQIKLANSSETEKASLNKTLIELQEKIDSLNKEKEDLDFRLEHSSAGYVYVISNVGSFGENIVKIGVTRRLEPLDRINELSSASVPFKFDVHALIFSYDAYGLEKELHEKFSDNRINKINMRKEFFNINITELKSYLTKYKDLTFDFVETPIAEEYIQTLKLIQNKNK